ncbi:Thivi_2564 family membrane protein [Emticicia aquatilis]|uniref:Thivi_2564 family membrane protein n=1 Tax=Emticicia aquatilis TaxID=1537369 RepID=UPI00166C5E46|nr:Thivi_2564 family membrane protein [Emticicia aquatilis]
MPLVNILVVLIVAGIVLWLINSYIPMDGKIKRILNIVFVVVIIIWLLKAFGLLSGLMNINV